MTDPAAPWPSWVRQPDGRLTPFEPDRISRDLFAATERLGQPDAFLARELTDSILHFLGQELEGGVPTPAQIVEVAVKVVRELGHPQLAQAFAATGPAEPVATANAERLGPTQAQVESWLHGEVTPLALERQIGRATLREYSLRAVFSRDVAAAHGSGLISLGNLEMPLDLAGCVCGLSSEQLLAGQLTVFDSADYLMERPEQVEGKACLLRGRLDRAGLRGVVNLNSEIPPPGAAELGEGPLFAAPQPATDGSARQAIADALLEQLLTADNINLRVDWHLGPSDFQAPNEIRLGRVAQRAADGAPIAFVFDRPRRPVALAEGIDRRHTATLMTIGLNLPAFVAQTELTSHPEWLAGKLGSLVRLAFSAAACKRDYLRRHAGVRPALTQGFLLDRARLVLVPIGLAAAAEILGGPAMARAIVQHLHEAIQQEARTRSFGACLDSADGFAIDDATRLPAYAAHAAGLTTWDAQLAPRQQLRAAGLLHAETKTGTAAVLFPADSHPTAEQIAELLRYAWDQTDLCRVRLLRLDIPRQALPALWAE